MSAEKKNEMYASSTTSTDDDDGGYVVDECEEEDGAYKTSSVATLSQSEHIIQQQQQEQRENALISTICLFFVRTWNWLHHFLVTIIFLNFVHFAVRRDCVLREARSVDFVEDEKQLETDSEINFGTDTEGESETCSSDEEEDHSSVENFNSNCDIGKMSPNTCPIQNQEEVEKAQEAIIVKTASEDKSEISPIIAPEEDQKINVKTEDEPTIIIVLPEDDAEDEDDEEVEENDVEDENQGIVVGKLEMSTARRDSVDSSSSDGSGNLGDTEDGSSDTKSTEENNNAVTFGDDVDNRRAGDNDVASKIISQVESMFSDEHLSKDGFLLKHVRRRSDGFVSLKLVAGLRKVKQISREFPVVLNALRDSSKLEINGDGTKVRRVEPLTPLLKSLPIKSKEKDVKGKEKENHSDRKPSLPGSKPENKDSYNQNRRHSSAQQTLTNTATTQNGQPRRLSNAQNNHYHQQHRKGSATSTTSSSNSSRHNSFSRAPGHPADLLRDVCMGGAFSSSGEDCTPQVGRRRGGSLPIAAINNRTCVIAGGAYLSPNSSPPNNGTYVIGPNGARPKSNSYCEGAGPTTMSPWLQRRKASASSRLSSGDLVFAGVVRQPKGPDGTTGFPSGYRALILQERLHQQNSAVSA